jgi:hypothetical protein
VGRTVHTHTCLGGLKGVERTHTGQWWSMGAAFGLQKVLQAHPTPLCRHLCQVCGACRSCFEAAVRQLFGSTTLTVLVW